MSFLSIFTNIKNILTIVIFIGLGGISSYYYNTLSGKCKALRAELNKQKELNNNVNKTLAECEAYKTQVEVEKIINDISTNNTIKEFLEDKEAKEMKIYENNNTDSNITTYYIYF